MKNNVKVIMKDFEIHTTPLEKIIISMSSIEIYLDDIYKNRYKLFAQPYQAIKVITIDCMSSTDFYNEFCYRDGRYHKHILQVEDSDYLNELRAKTFDSSFLNNSNHFVLPLQDNIIELIAYELNVCRLTEDSEAESN